MEASTDASSAWLKFCLSVVKSRTTRLVNENIGQYTFYLHNNVNVKSDEKCIAISKVTRRNLSGIIPIMH